MVKVRDRFKGVAPNVITLAYERWRCIGRMQIAQVDQFASQADRVGVDLDEV